MKFNLVTHEEHKELVTMYEALKDEISELRKMVSTEYISPKEAQKYVGKTKQKFYDFIAYHEVRTTGVGKGIKYRVSDLDMGLRLEGKKCG